MQGVADDDLGSDGRGRRLRRWSAWALFAGLAAGALLCASARWFWLGEVAVSFRWQFGLACGGAALLLVILGSRRLALGSFLIASVAAGPETLLSLGTPPPAAGRERLRILSANVLWQNDRYDDVLAMVARVDPDVVAILESSERSVAAYDEGLSGAFPYQVEALDGPRWHPGTWAVKLYSRLPIRGQALVAFPELEPRPRAAIEVEVALGEGAVRLQVVHAPRAGKAWRNAARDLVLGRMAERQPDPGVERVLFGDLNLTSGSPAFARLLRAGDLRDSRAGFGRLPSWTAAGHLRLPPSIDLAGRTDLSWIPIDHALVSPGLDVVERRTETIPGSDHRAVVVEVALRFEDAGS